MADCDTCVCTNAECKATCSKCQECGGGGDPGNVVLPGFATPAPGMLGYYISWETRQDYPIRVDSVNVDGTVNLTDFFLHNTGEYRRVNMGVAHNQAEVDHYREERDEFLDIVDIHSHEFAKMWKRLKQPFPKGPALVEDENTGQWTYLMAYVPDLNCPAQILFRHGKKADAKITFISGNGWNNVKGIQVLKDNEEITQFIALRFEFWRMRKVYRQAAEEEWSKYQTLNP